MTIPSVEEMPYDWVAVYEDGSTLEQYNEDGSENRYADIQRKRVTEFHLRSRTQNRTLLAVEITAEDRLIYRRRNSMNGVSGEKNWTIFMVGWQKTLGGRNVQSINWIFPDGSIINTGRFQENHPLFYGIQWLAEEDEQDLSAEAGVSESAAVAVASENDSALD